MKKKEFIDYANSFQEIARLELESITLLMNELKNPQDNLKFIHVAGTNGKGSVCSFLQNILTSSGYRVGKYISPNMVRVNERITINSVEITDDELNKVMEIVMEKANLVKMTTGDMPTQFEIWTACAFLWFSMNSCDYVVLETGLGGTRDATNVIKNPVATIITKVAKDHTEYLGKTLGDIAKEKAGIIKKCDNEGVTITIPQNTEVMSVLEKRAIECDNKFIVAKVPNVHEFLGSYEIFDYDGIFNIKMQMLGEHQSQNASLAIEAARLLGILQDNIKEGILKARNIGRFEIISKEPLILFDGAHNKNGMGSLAKGINRCFGEHKKSFIMACMRDKEIEEAVLELKKYGYDKDSSFYTVSVVDNPRSEDANTLSKRLVKTGILSTPCVDIKEAINKASQDKDLIVICGSLYLYKDVINALEK